MERPAVRGLARPDGLRRATGGLPRLRLRLGSLTSSEAACLALTLLLASGFAAWFATVALLRWNSYETNAFDLGFFDQVIWNTSRGDWFQTTFVPYNFAGQHLEPVLLAFLPAYSLGAGPPVLLLTQAVVAAGAAVPLYLAARRFTLPAWLAVAVAASYLANPYLQRAIAFDFHPEVMVALPAFAAAWAIAARRTRLAVVLALSTLLFKEDAVFVALALAGLALLNGQRRPAAIISAAALAWAALVVLVVLPLARHGAPSDLVQRYGYLAGGRDGFGLLASVVLHPWRPLAELTAPANLWTAAIFLACSGLLALARPWLLVPLLPGLALAILSAHPQQKALELHYAAELVPVAVLATLLAALTLRQRIAAPLLASLVLVPAVLGAIVLHPLPSAHGDPPSGAHLAALGEAVALVPADPDVSVSAQSGVLPRLTRRGQAFEFPSNFDRADYVVVDRYGFRSSQSLADGFDPKLARVRTEMQRIYERDGVEVFRRSP